MSLKMQLKQNLNEVADALTDVYITYKNAMHLV